MSSSTTSRHLIRKNPDSVAKTLVWATVHPGAPRDKDSRPQ